MRLERLGKEFTKDELDDLARLLAEIYVLHNEIMSRLNRRVRVDWLDMMNSKALKYYSKLRSELEESWLRVHGSGSPNPFYGTPWHERTTTDRE